MVEVVAALAGVLVKQILTWTGKYKLGAIAKARVGIYNLGIRTGKCKVLARVDKHKLGARAGKYKLGARASKYKLGARAGKYKLEARASKNRLGARAGKYKDPQIL